MKHFSILLVQFLLLFCFDNIAQPDTIADILDLTLAELMVVKIISASREEESSFDAPVSSYAITKNEILQSGATSVPDVLRLCPGIIVREIANGTYDVSIRGGIDGYPAYNYSFVNTSILAMIDNRPVFSSLQGGTYWQNLPVGINDIERIEIVYGPSSPLFGPNAVSGVINIITKQDAKEKSSISGGFFGGPNTNLMSLNTGIKISEKLYAQAGLSYEYRTRFDERFYDYTSESYIIMDSIDSEIVHSELGERFPNLDRSLVKLSGTANIFYDYNENIQFKLGGGLNQNMGLQPLRAGIGLSNFTNQSQYFEAATYVKNFTFQASYLYGVQGLTGNLHNNDYNYSNTDIYADYNLGLWKDKIGIRPALSYQSAYINDKEYTIDVGKSGRFNGEGTLNNLAGSLKIDARPVNSLRLIFAGRYDKFNFPEKGIFSYQGIINYNLKALHLFRAVVGKFYNGSFMIPSLINSTEQVRERDGIIPGLIIHLNGNMNLDLLNNTMFELGYRVKAGKFLNFDLAYYHQRFKGFSNLILHIPNIDDNWIQHNRLYRENIPLELSQNAVTVSANMSFLNQRILVRPNISWQHTMASNYSPYYNQKEAYDVPIIGHYLQGHRDSTYSNEEQFTPGIYGGISITVKAIKQLSINVSDYFYSDYILHSSLETDLAFGNIVNQKGSQIASKNLLNATISYTVLNNLTFVLTIRNILNQTAPEGMATDLMGTSFMAGIHLSH